MTRPSSRVSHVKRLAAVAAALACSAACAGEEEPRSVRAEAEATLQSQLTEPVRLVGSFLFEGRRRRVEARVLNRRPEPFPFEWARLRGYDSSGNAG